MKHFIDVNHVGSENKQTKLFYRTQLVDLPNYLAHTISKLWRGGGQGGGGRNAFIKLAFSWTKAIILYITELSGKNDINMTWKTRDTYKIYPHTMSMPEFWCQTQAITFWCISNYWSTVLELYTIGINLLYAPSSPTPKHKMYTICLS